MSQSVSLFSPSEFHVESQPLLHLVQKLPIAGSPALRVQRRRAGLALRVGEPEERSGPSYAVPAAPETPSTVLQVVGV